MLPVIAKGVTAWVVVPLLPAKPAPGVYVAVIVSPVVTLNLGVLVAKVQVEVVVVVLLGEVLSPSSVPVVVS
jgi:hypothetical protein